MAGLRPIRIKMGQTEVATLIPSWSAKADHPRLAMLGAVLCSNCHHDMKTVSGWFGYHILYGTVTCVEGASVGQLAGEIQKAERALAKMSCDLNTIDATLNIFESQTNPDLIPAIVLNVRSVFFDCEELAGLSYSTLRNANGSLTTGRIVDYAIQAKGLDADQTARKGIVDIVRRRLCRMEKPGRIRRVLEEPEVSWEVAV